METEQIGERLMVENEQEVQNNNEQNEELCSSPLLDSSNDSDFSTETDISLDFKASLKTILTGTIASFFHGETF